MSDPQSRPKEKKDKPLRYKNPLAKGKFRNDPCVCGSGKKVKKCHGVNSSVSKQELDLILQMIDNFNKRFKEAMENNLKAEVERLSKGDLSGGQQETKDSQ